MFASVWRIFHWGWQLTEAMTWQSEGDLNSAISAPSSESGSTLTHLVLHPLLWRVILLFLYSSRVCGQFVEFCAARETRLLVLGDFVLSDFLPVWIIFRRLKLANWGYQQLVIYISYSELTRRRHLGRIIIYHMHLTYNASNISILRTNIEVIYCTMIF